MDKSMDMADSEYYELHIDVFDQLNQRAQVLPELKPPELISAILEEFGELEYLGSEASGYGLRKHGSAEVLEERKPLRTQVKAGDRLVLVEIEARLPDGTSRPSHNCYLREHSSGGTFKIPWVPAIVGRADTELAENDLLAVDLSSCPGGARVSRRHLRLWQEDDEFLIHAASTNPVSLVRGDCEISVPRESDAQRLISGDIIRLDRSGIRLKFVVRKE